MPANVEPKAGQVARHGTFSWDQGGVKPDVATMVAVDVTSVGGCCCDDLNGNGQCESWAAAAVRLDAAAVHAVEPVCAGRARELRAPVMQGGVNAFDSPNTYFWIVEQAVAPRFDYREFIYNQFSPFFWTSWSVWYSQFVSKEETP